MAAVSQKLRYAIKTLYNYAVSTSMPDETVDTRRPARYLLASASMLGISVLQSII